MRSFLLAIFLCFSANIFAQQTLRLSGKISNAQSESLSGVEISVKDLDVKKISNIKGEYLINLKPGNYTLTFSLSGYNTNISNLKLEKNTVLNVVLVKDKQMLDVVVVNDQSTRIEGMTGINARNFELSPNVAQSFEAMLKQLPGVSTNNELSSQYSVRGGNFDENLIYINDVEIFKPYLVRNGQQEGLSLINPDLISNVKFSAGGFSARYGDKLSSVLDVNYKTRDTTASVISVGTNGLSASTFFVQKKFNVALSFRNKRNRFVLNAQPIRGSYDPRFYDLQTLVNYKANSRLNVEFLGIANSSEFSLLPQSRETTFGTLQQTLRLRVNYEGQEIDQYTNLVGALTFNYKLNDKAKLKWINSAFIMSERENFDITGSYLFDEVETDFLGGGFGNVVTNRGIGAFQDYGRNQMDARVLASDIKYYFSKNNTHWETSLRFQQDYIKDELLEFNYLDSAGYTLPNDNTNGFPLFDYRNASNTLTTNRISGYILNTSDIGEHFILASGLRFNYNSFTKEFLPSPRLVLTYNPKKEKDIIYRFASGYYVQTPFYRELRGFDGQINPDVKSQKSLHFIASSDYKFKSFGTNLRFNTEVYYKALLQLTPYELENLRVRYNAGLTSKGYAAGLDFSISGEFVRDLESSFRLSLMKTEEDINGDSFTRTDANGNQQVVFPGFIKRPTDQRVNFSIFFQDRLFNSPTYKVHLSLLYGSRLPSWPPKTNNFTTNFTIPPYRRVDIGFSKDILDKESIKRFKWFDTYFNSFIVYAEVFNLLNINNTVSYLWLTDVNNNRYAIPNFLTSRQLNFKIIAKF
ncbi:TonB-dependent receptor [Pedobacter glucosidilyticus]|uniref:TonB-dependent receptor n=1 Tax=Pedobacter glucosidilyticus TaxID=1122941 RepID=UPI0026EFFFA5|nr:carboxypeptidase-like regulatory domain-containing protein [Pedobacter glucosidilyticus]